MNAKWVEDSALRPSMRHCLTHFSCFYVSLTCWCSTDNLDKQLLLLSRDGAQSFWLELLELLVC